MGILQRWTDFVYGPEPQPARSAFPSLTFDDVAQWLTSGTTRFPTTTMTGTTETIEGSYGGYAAGAYSGNGIVFACMQVRFSLFSEARFQWRQLRSGRPGDLFGTAALAPLEKPWPNGTTGDLLARLLVCADLGGNGWVVQNKAGGLRVLRPDWVTSVYGSERKDATSVESELVGLIHVPGGKSSGNPPETFTRGEFAHFAPTPDPLSPLTGMGMSWLTPVLREVRGDTGYTEHKLKFLQNAATPNMVVTFDPSVTAKAFEDWTRAFERQHKGALNAYKTLYLGGGTEAKPVGSDFVQMDFKAVQGAGETRIAAAAGVPPVVVGFSEGLSGSSLNAGNYVAARRRLADLTMRPLWRNVCGSLSSLVTVPAQAELWYDDRDIAFLQEDVKDAADIQQQEALTIRQLVDAGFTPDDVVEAVTAGDLKRLMGRHTGLFSVQLQEPGAAQDVAPARSVVHVNARLSPSLADIETARMRRERVDTLRARVAGVKEGATAP